MNAFRVKRTIQNGREIGVGNECDGAAECIELHVIVHREGNDCPTWVEAHMNYADAQWLRDHLSTALLEVGYETLHPGKPKGSKKRKKTGTIKHKTKTKHPEDGTPK